jgi:NAD(P)-dependent dehydrogenase (short-subunit alcohol dehydrogenase family)
VNLRVPFLLSKAAFPRMREAGSGMIVNFSSVVGKKGWANASAYCASKFGLTGLTDQRAEKHGYLRKSLDAIAAGPVAVPS